MDIRKLQRAIVDGLEDVKAHDIVVFNTEHLSPLFERVIVASGTSNRQTKALAASVRDAVKAQGMTALRTEGEENGEWIIVDCGAAVAHIMQPAIRVYYRLEEIWGEKPVRIKLAGEASRGLVKASEDMADEPMAKPAKAAKPGVKKAPARKSAIRQASPTRPSRGAAADDSASSARKAAPKKAAAGSAKSAPARKSGSTRVGKVTAGSPATQTMAVKWVAPRTSPAAKKAAGAARKTETAPTTRKVVVAAPPRKTAAPASARKAAAAPSPKAAASKSTRKTTTSSPARKTAVKAPARKTPSRGGSAR
jgi:ribosome-associated protein